MPTRRERVLGARRAVAWGLLFALVGQVGLALLIDHRLAVLRDPEYAHRLARLRATWTAHPGRPLLLALGSSRTGVGFRPAVLPSDNATPLAFNFALNGAGPVQQLLCYERLLDDGVRPRWLVVEVFPSMLCDNPMWAEEHRLAVCRMTWRDVGRLKAYFADPAARRREWLGNRLAPWHANRFAIISRYVPALLPVNLRQDAGLGLDDYGWRGWMYERVTPEQYAEGLASEARKYANTFPDYRISPAADRALRRLLALARREGTAVLFVVMPEASDFRAWYKLEGRATFEAYLTRLAGENALPTVEATYWRPDSDFADGHHLLPGGAAAFTERLGREVLGPWIRGHKGEGHAAAP